MEEIVKVGVLRNQDQLFFKAPFIVPVPLHSKRFKQRGFNQAEVLARAMCLNLPDGAVVDCIKRREYQEKQSTLERSERIQNLSNAFRVKTAFRSLVDGKLVYLVDDVCTTGSTLNECSKVLKEAGVKKVCGFVLAKS